MNIISKISNLGIRSDVPDIENRRTVVCNQLALAAVFIPMPFFLINISELQLVGLFILHWLAIAAVFILNKYGYTRTARSLFVFSICNIFYWMGIFVEAKWPELKVGFIATQMGFYSFPLVLFSIRDDKWIVYSFLLLGIVQVSLFNTLDQSIEIIFSDVSHESASIQNVMQIASAILVLSISFGFYQRITRQSEERVLDLLEETQQQNDELQAAEEEIRQSAHELQATLNQVEDQKQTLLQQKEDIVESIQYARRIQTAILPPDHMLSSVLPDSFVFYRPKDIVSGDFYWLHHANGKIWLAVVDCTGHGVPGAFMSVMAYSLLNQIVSEETVSTPAQLLTELDIRVQRTLRQQGNSESQDGMDIASCMIDIKGNEMSFAGAGRSLYMLRNGNLECVSGSKFPVGGAQHNEKLFVAHNIQMTAGDRFYLFSDGITDQFGIQDGRRRKFSPKRLRDWITNNQKTDLADQRHMFSHYFDAWKGSEEQLDDVSMLAFQWK